MTDEKPENCQCCGYETSDLRGYPVRRMDGSGSKWLCGLCAGTLAGSAMDFPSQYRHELATMQTICYVGNAILDALKTRAGDKPEQQGDVRDLIAGHVRQIEILCDGSGFDPYEFLADHAAGDKP